jgi:hypothetical protein
VLDGAVPALRVPAREEELVALAMSAVLGVLAAGASGASAEQPAFRA